MTDVTVENNPEAHRYEAHLDGDLAGFAEYQLTDDLIVFTHTVVEPEHEGQGVGTALARFALDDVRAQGDRRVLALCWFIQAFIERNPEYADLVYDAPASTARD